MDIGKSSEDYLESILILSKKHDGVRSIHIAQQMGVTKASVCNAIKLLKKKKLVQMDSNKRIYLTDEGGTLASEVYEKHKFFKRLLIDSGVCEGIASRDACRIEHAISDASFDKLKAYYNIINSTKQES